MIAVIDWDTATVLTVILAPLCLLFVGIIFVQWQRINELKNDKHTAVAKVAELNKVVSDSRADCDRHLTEACAQKDAEIKRQKEDIEGLHKDLHLANTHLDCYRQDAVRRDMWNDYTFDKRLGVYRHKSKPGYFCGSCTPKKIESPLKETEQGWQCLIDSKHWHPNPDYRPPPTPPPRTPWRRFPV